MDLDLETFLTALYVIVDDFYQSHIRPMMPARGGPPAVMSDSEVLCLALAAQWRSGVPWKSERGVSIDTSSARPSHVDRVATVARGT